MARSRGRTIASLIVLALFLGLIYGSASAQVMGDEAELDRLRIKAEDAMANDDPEGAAMSMGRAALMTVYLAQREGDPTRVKMFRGAEHLLRSQEHGYRALALFRRGGDQLPASTGVCGSLQLAHTEVQLSLQIFDERLPAEQPDPRTIQHAKGLREAAENWVTVLSSMHTDFQCAQPDPSGPQSSSGLMMCRPAGRHAANSCRSELTTVKRSGLSSRARAK